MRVLGLSKVARDGDWDINGGAGTIHGNLAVTAGTISTAAQGKDFRVGFLSQALADNETIDSVRACIKGHTGNTRSATHDVRIDIENASNSAYFTDTHTVTENGGSVATYCSAAETINPATSAAWEQGAIDAIRMDVEITSFSGGSPTCVLYEAYITVVTTIPPSQTTYTSDDQVTLSGGTLEFKNGMTVIGSKN